MGLADYGTLRPLELSRVVHHFGTDRPSADQYEKLVAAANDGHESSLLDECQMRWIGYYVTEARPAHLGILGFSGDQD